MWSCRPHPAPEGVVAPHPRLVAAPALAIGHDRVRQPPAYRPLAGRHDRRLAFQAARALVFEGVEQPNGYTEPLLHAYRATVKAEPSR